MELVVTTCTSSMPALPALPALPLRVRVSLTGKSEARFPLLPSAIRPPAVQPSRPRDPRIGPSYGGEAAGLGHVRPGPAAEVRAHGYVRRL